jgi:hypothetical protein
MIRSFKMITEMIKQIELDIQETYSHEEVIEMLNKIREGLKEAINKSSWEWDIGIVGQEIENIIGEL